MHPARRLIDILGLSALTVAYPTFDLLSQNTEFFVARNTTLAQVVALVLVLCVLLPVLFFSLELIAQAIRQRLVPFVHSVLLGILTVAMVMPWLKRLEGLSDLTGPLALAIGAVFVLGHYRASAIQMFVTALVPAIIPGRAGVDGFTDLP